MLRMKKRRLRRFEMKFPAWLTRVHAWLTHRIHHLTRTQRIVCAGIAGVIVLSVTIPVVQHFIDKWRYGLDSQMLSLVGSVNKNLAAKLTYDSEGSRWQFNKNALSAISSTSDQAPMLTSQAGGGGENDTSLYAANFPTDPAKGVEFYDTQTELSFTMTPQFDLYNARATDGRLIYPLKNGAKLIYTAKNNGMKEDIILPKFIGKEPEFAYTLSLPKTLQAKILDDGSVGIFSADPVLFGKISTASDMDAEKLKSAREQGEKNHLLFAIPAPVIKQSGDGTPKATARFVLSGDTLRVVTHDMDQLHYPVSVDPSVVVTSSSDFASGNNEDSIYFATDQINRNTVMGGGISNGWSSTGSGSFTARSVAGSAVYNGYLYLIGGIGIGLSGDVSYAPINSNGTVGTWSSTTALSTNRSYMAAVPYNGKMYVYGGYTSGTSALNSVLYADINSDGTLGTWTTASNSMATAACRFGWTGYNGYLYAVGGAVGTVASNCGNGSSTMTNTIQYAPILANGDVGAWTTSANTFTNARKDLGFAIYNGNAYISSGTTDGITTYRDTQIATVNSNGDIGTWRTAAEQIPTSGKYRFGYRAYNGYLYLSGGTNNMTGTLYAPIYANGDIGAWQSSSTMPTGRYGQGFALYKGYAYYFGGNDGSSYLNDTGYAKIDPAGQNRSYTASSSFTTNRRGSQTVAYNGYLYVMGGDAGGSPGNTIRRAALNTDGTIGSFSTDRALPANLTFFSAVAYGGYMYVVGGCTSAFSSCTTAGNNVATVYRSAISTSDGSLGAWNTDTSFTTARYGLSAVAYNGYLYVLGGLNGSTFQSDIQYHAISASGAISGAWSTSSYTISTARAYQGVAVNSGKLYVTGGCSAGALTCTTTQNDIQYGTFGASGELTGSLTTNGTSFSISRGMHGFVINNGYAYVIGGWNGSTYYGDTQFAPINADGSLGNWSTGRALSSVRAGAGYATYGGTLYIAGGNNGGTYYSDTYYSPLHIGGSGANGSWTTSGNTFTTGRTGHASVAYNNYIYVIGGIDSGGNRLTSVYYAALGADGTVGSWSSTTAIPTATEALSAVVSKGYVYIFGGKTGSSTMTGAVYSAPLNSNGTVGSWTMLPSLPDQASAMAPAVYNGYVYLLGGINNTVNNTVYYAALNSDGTMGSWGTTTNFTTARRDAGAVANGGYLYIIGGYDGTNYLKDIQYASINSNGTLGSWNSTTEMTTTRAYITPTVLNGFLYIYGGYDGTSDYSRVEYAPLLASGGLGTWNSGATFSDARYGHQAVTSGGYAYVTGGYDGSTYYNNVQYAAFQTNPRIATYSKLFDLGALYSLTGISYGGSLPGGTSAISYRTAGTNGVLGSSALASSIIGSSSCKASSVRYVFVTVSFDDTALASLPDEAGSESYLTDLSVQYSQGRAPVDKRLAHGKYFDSETLQPLDTCGA